MYQLVKAIGKNYDGSRWSDVEIGDVSMKVLFSTYRYLWATLSNPFLDAQVALDMNLIREAQRFNELTFNQYLVSLGNIALPTVNDLPVIDTKYVKYADVWKAGYTVTPIHDTAAIDSPLPVAEKHLLQLTKSGLTYSDFYDYCLVTVNGMYHWADGNVNGVYVKDGMKSINVAGDNQLGLTSFKDIGKISCIPITDAMIYKQNPDEPYSQSMYLDLGVDYTGKQVFICIGGYLHILDKRFFRRVSDTCFLLDFNGYPLIKRYYQSKKLIDLSSLNMYENPHSESAIEMDQLLADSTMVALMKLSQTFVVVLDSEEFFYEKQFIIPGKIPGIHISTVEPLYPMIVDLGKVANYWPHSDDNLWSLQTSNSLKHVRAFDTTTPYELPVVSDQRKANDPVRQSNAFFQIMGRDR